MSVVRDALERAGVEADKYAGRSFRIGAATTFRRWVDGVV